MNADSKEFKNCSLLDTQELSWFDYDDFLEEIRMCCKKKQRLLSLDAPDDHTLIAVLANDIKGHMRIFCGKIVNKSYPAITPWWSAAHLFEREIHERTGILPREHPWLKPVRYTGSGYKPGEASFYKIESLDIHEVSVGPVHAGIIEPGHFRFQCFGERVFHLEIALGYQHKGIEKAIEGGPRLRTLHHMQTLAGDSSIAHSTAYCHALETLANVQVSGRAQALRGIALELERLANHTGDLGALAGDVGFLPTASYCGRIRGDFLNMTAALCGNRFGRNFLVPGGVQFDISPAQASALLQRLDAAEKDLESAVPLLWHSQTVLMRFETTGALKPEQAEQAGLVGPAARACGIARDVRSDHPSGIFRFRHIPVSVYDSGDVFARAYVRWLEIKRSLRFIREQLEGLPRGHIEIPPGKLKPNSCTVSLVEGWRGEVCHVVQTDAEGKFARYKVIDPSFRNWTGLALCMRNQEISDFPLCNKSLNLSYTGFDL